VVVGLLILTLGRSFLIYLKNRAERSDRETAKRDKSVDASLAAHKPFTDKVRRIDDYVESLVEEDVSAKTREVLSWWQRKNALLG